MKNTFFRKWKRLKFFNCVPTEISWQKKTKTKTKKYIVQITQNNNITLEVGVNKQISSDMQDEASFIVACEYSCLQGAMRGGCIHRLQLYGYIFFKSLCMTTLVKQYILSLRKRPLSLNDHFWRDLVVFTNLLLKLQRMRHFVVAMRARVGWKPVIRCFKVGKFSDNLI